MWECVLVAVVVVFVVEIKRKIDSQPIYRKHHAPYTLKLFVSSLEKSEQFSIDFISFMFIRCNSSNPCSSTSNIHPCQHPHAIVHPTHLSANTIHLDFHASTTNHTMPPATITTTNNFTSIIISIYIISHFHFHYVSLAKYEEKKLSKKKKCAAVDRMFKCIRK